MPITKPEEMDFSKKKLFIIIAGVPGIGKTTLALSAPKPLLIDMDNGVSRVEARHRKDTLTGGSIEAIEDELSKADLSAYESIVLDTGGAAFDLLKQSIVATNPKARQSDGSLSLKGYGIAKSAYKAFVDFLRSLNKHLIIVFHASETTVDEDLKLTGYRIRIEGATRNEIWDGADLGGFMETRGNKRTLSFASNDRFYAKGTRGVHGTYNIPDLSDGKPNDFLARLIAVVQGRYAEEVEELKAYERAMEFAKVIAQCKTIGQCDTAAEHLAKVKHALTSKDELTAILNAKREELAHGETPDNA